MKHRHYIRLSTYVAAFFTILLLAISCKNAAEKKAEKIIEKSIEKSTGEDVDIDIENQKTIIETEDGRIEVNALTNSWPDDIPAGVPEFTYGKISGATSSSTDEGKLWTIVFTDVPGNATEKYDSDLKGKGFKTQSVNMSGLGGTISAEKNNITIAAMVGDGEASISVQVSSE